MDPAQPTPKVQLNSQQQAALDQMVAFLGSREPFFLLKGYAGTGKTTTIQALLTRYRRKRDIVLTAPTHKATQVLTRTAYDWGMVNLDAMTIHRLLGLVVRSNGEGGQTLSAEGVNKLPNYNLVILDECSMINRELCDLLQAQAQDFPNVQFILIGDPAQLPPVNEDESATFQILPCAELTQVMRQQDSNPIGPVLDRIRADLTAAKTYERTSHLNDSKTEGILCLTNRRHFLDLLLKALRSESFPTDPDYVRALAWTNREVSSLNTYIRSQLYGATAPRFIPGERLIARDAILDPDNGRILLNSCAEVKVEAVQEGTNAGYRAWILDLTTEEGDALTLPVLHEEAQPSYQEQIQMALNLAKDATFLVSKDPTQAQQKKRTQAWEAYENTRHLFAALDYCYALTIHKAQGSGFRNVFVVDSDVDKNRNVRERNQCRYVAYSRAIDRLFVLHPARY